MNDFDIDTLRLYPDPNSQLLVDAIAKRYDVDSDQVFVGVGSDDVLAIAFMTFFNGKKPVLFPDITYSFYNVWAELFNIPYERPALDEHFNIVAEDYYKENGGVIIANPNAPTGIEQNEAFLREVIEHNQDVVVIIDEAYVDFGGVSAVPLLKKYENLVVVQTMSKSRSLAGMRIGMAFGHPNLIAGLNAVKNSFNAYTLDRLGIVAGTAAVEDEDYFQTTRNQVIATRERTAARLRELGFLVHPSCSNFLFITHPGVPASRLKDQLRQRGILVRYFNQPRIDNYLRVSIGTAEDMETFCKEIAELVQ